MSLNLTVTIPLETAAILRKAHDSRTADQDVDSALFTVANAVIDAVKALPWSITTSPALEENRNLSPYGVLTPPLSTYSKESSSYSRDLSGSFSRQPSDSYSQGNSSGISYMGRQLPDSSSEIVISSRSTSASIPASVPEGGSASSSESDSWWSARESYCDDFSIDIVDIVNGEEEIYYLSVTGTMTVEEVAFRAEQVSGVPAEALRLVWKGYRLNLPDAKLSTYGIGDGSKLHLLRKAPSVDTLPASDCEEEEPFQPYPGYEIIVQTVGDKQIPMLVQDETTTAELASAVFDRQGICPGLQRLVHRGNVIFDGYAYDSGEAHLIYTLEELGIGPESVVILYFCNTMR